MLIQLASKVGFVCYCLEDLVSAGYALLPGPENCGRLVDLENGGWRMGCGMPERYCSVVVQFQVQVEADTGS